MNNLLRWKDYRERCCYHAVSIDADLFLFCNKQAVVSITLTFTTCGPSAGQLLINRQTAVTHSNWSKIISHSRLKTVQKEYIDMWPCRQALCIQWTDFECIGGLILVERHNILLHALTNAYSGATSRCSWSTAVESQWEVLERQLIPCHRICRMRALLFSYCAIDLCRGFGDRCFVNHLITNGLLQWVSKCKVASMWHVAQL